MPFSEQFWRAVADYGVLFVDLDSLGAGNPPADWLTEYQRVRATAFASVLITSAGFEGGSGSGQRQFPQEVLIDALHCRRYDLDNDYVLPRNLALYPSAAVVADYGEGGLTIRFSP